MSLVPKILALSSDVILALSSDAQFTLLKITIYVELLAMEALDRTEGLANKI